MIKFSEDNNLNNGRIFMNIQFHEDYFIIYLIGNNDMNDEIVEYRTNLLNYCNIWLCDLSIDIDIIRVNFKPSEYPDIIYHCYSDGVIMSYNNDRFLTVSSSGYMSRIVSVSS